MNSIPDEIYSNALVALEKIKNNTPLTIDFEEWFLIGDFGQEDKATEYNHRVLYLLLKQLKALIDPLLIDITHIDKTDANNKYFVCISAYFSTLLKQIERRVYSTYTPASDSHLADILNVVDVPLTRYLQKRESDKKNMRDLLESTILALSDIESQYLSEKPDQIAVPITETKDIFESLNDFVKAYKKKIEGDEFDHNAAIGEFQRKFGGGDVVVDTPIPEKHSSKYYITKTDGDFYYDGNLIKTKKSNQSYKIFSAFFDYANKGGSIPYNEIHALIQKIKGFEKLNQEKLHKKMLRALTDNTNGFIAKSKIKHTTQKPLFTLEVEGKINFNNKRS